MGFCRRGPSCLPLFNAFVPCHWLSNGNQVDLKCNFFPLVGWVGWYLLLVKAPSAAVMPPQRPVMGLLCVGAWVDPIANFARSRSLLILSRQRLLDDRSVSHRRPFAPERARGRACRQRPFAAETHAMGGPEHALSWEATLHLRPAVATTWSAF